MDWIRARKPEQVELRRQAILQAAGRLFADRGYDAVTLDGIARGAGTAKSNLYRYFASKEAIYTHIYLHEMRLWADCFVQTTADVPVGDVERFAAVAAHSVNDCPRLAELMTLLAGVLERNLAEEQAVPFKLGIAALLEQPVAAVRRCSPSCVQSVRRALHHHARTGGWAIPHAGCGGATGAAPGAARPVPHGGALSAGLSGSIAHLSQRITQRGEPTCLRPYILFPWSASRALAACRRQPGTAAAVADRHALDVRGELPVKVHFGEKGNTTFIPAAYYDGLLDVLRAGGAEPFYIETNVLYRGQRTHRADHERLAVEHGFTQVPVRIADGESGEAYTEVEINAKHFRKCKVGQLFSITTACWW
jgi:AcrR family transcriptional regulator